jgi:hypothetical protein
MAWQIYYGGEFWYCTASTSAGQSPVTHPAKWSQISIPNELRSPIASLAAARLFAQEDNIEQSAGAEQLGRIRLDEAIVSEHLAPKAGTGISAVRT